MLRVRAISDPVHYAYAVGRVRVLEGRLLSRSTYERLLDAKSFSEQQRILSETPYGGYLETSQTAEDVEQALDTALGDLYREFLECAKLPEAIVRYFRTMHDFENLRGRLKAESLGIDARELVTDLGSAPADAAAEGRAVPPQVAAAERRVREAAAEAGGELASTLIDAAVDSETYSVLGEIARDSRSKFLCDLAALSADLGNLKVFIRARAMDMPPAVVERLFVPGGSVPVSRFVTGYRLPIEDMVRRISALSGFRDVDPEAIMDPGRLDVAIEQVLARRLHEAQMVPCGPEPVLAYVAVRKTEMQRVRTLLIGKLVGVDTDVLRARVREVA